MRSFVILLFLGTLFSCSNSNIKEQFEEKGFLLNNNQAILGFDLSNDKTIKSSLIISNKKDLEIISRAAILPFTVKEVSRNDEYLCSTVSLTGYTVVNYNVLSSDRDKYFLLNLIPTWEENLDINNNQTIFWVKSGLNRKFIYEPYKAQTGISDRILQMCKIVDSINLIGVKLPIDSKVIENRDKNNVVISANIVGDCRFYDLQAVPQNKLEVEYQIKPSKEQLKFADLLLKFLTLITIPLIQLFVLKENREKPKLRLVVIVVGILFELTAIGLIARYSILNDSFSAFYDLSLYFISVIFTGFVLYLNRK
jgi:hypothetical protein